MEERTGPDAAGECTFDVRLKWGLSRQQDGFLVIGDVERFQINLK